MAVSPGVESHLLNVVKGVAGYASQRGFRSKGHGHRPGSGSAYITLVHKANGWRYRIRVSNHRHPGGHVHGVAYDLVNPQGEDVRRLRAWIDRQAEKAFENAAEALHA